MPGGPATAERPGSAARAMGTTERPRRRGEGWACSLRGSMQPSSQAESHRARRMAVARQESCRPRPFVRPYDTLVGEWIKESGETDEQLFVPALDVFLRMSGLIPKYRCAACALGYSSSQTRRRNS